MTFNIYTNRAPYGLLTEDEKRQLMEHKGEYEVYSSKIDRFLQVSYPSWTSYVVYRAVRPAPTKPSINWNHVSDKFITMATNSFGMSRLFTGVPTPGTYGWDTSAERSLASSFASFVPGTCDWRDSLVIRPGYKGE